jgi:enamine deaminase RidA (YjgF/YER057c/UK114 family)
MDIYENLKKMNLTLPEPPKKGGAYVPVRQVGNVLYTAGVGPTKDGIPVIIGKVGKEVNVELARKAAELVILNMLSVLEVYLKDLNKIKKFVKMLAFVSSDNSFHDQPKVIDAASELLVKIFGERGEHARSAIGTNSLPGNIPVEIEFIIEI